jgi:hypothetical protein
MAVTASDDCTMRIQDRVQLFSNQELPLLSEMGIRP